MLSHAAWSGPGKERGMKDSVTQGWAILKRGLDHSEDVKKKHFYSARSVVVFLLL